MDATILWILPHRLRRGGPAKSIAAGPYRSHKQVCPRGVGGRGWLAPCWRCYVMRLSSRAATDLFGSLFLTPWQANHPANDPRGETATSYSFLVYVKQIKSKYLFDFFPRGIFHFRLMKLCLLCGFVSLAQSRSVDLATWWSSELTGVPLQNSPSKFECFFPSLSIKGSKFPIGMSQKINLWDDPFQCGVANFPPGKTVNRKRSARSIFTMTSVCVCACVWVGEGGSNSKFSSARDSAIVTWNGNLANQ